MRYHVYSHNSNGRVGYCGCSGSRGECKRFIRARGNHGFYFITTIDHPDKVQRRYGD